MLQEEIDEILPLVQYIDTAKKQKEMLDTYIKRDPEHQLARTLINKQLKNNRLNQQTSVFKPVEYTTVEALILKNPVVLA